MLVNKQLKYTQYKTNVTYLKQKLINLIDKRKRRIYQHLVKNGTQKQRRIFNLAEDYFCLLNEQDPAGTFSIYFKLLQNII